MSRVCVVIPCTPNDIAWLPYALASVGQQTLPPAVVSIQYSGFKDCTSVLNHPPLGHGVQLTQNCSASKLSCGGGRNAAVARCGPGIDFYKYFDADDEMMPYQLERMVKIMTDYNATIGYHGYYHKDSGSIVRNDAELRDRIRGDGGRWRKFSPFHELQTQHGQPMVRRSHWKPLDEHSTFQEDIRMAREAWVDPNQRFVHTTEKLTRYMRRTNPQKKRKFKLFGRRLRQTWHRPRRQTSRIERESQCTVVILAFPTHCGKDCLRGNKHTQDWNVAHMVGSLERFWFRPFRVHYPVHIFHQDYDDTQELAVRQRTRSPVFFRKLDLSPTALPKHLHKYFRRIMADVKPAHRGGNLSMPSMRGTYHGFGYRMMCRFFAGLIMHHDELKEFTWYMRVDAGDSRLTGPFTADPFVTMMRGNYRYGYQRIETAARNSRFDRVISNWTATLSYSKKLLEPFLDRNREYNGRYYYNNFEIVHLPTFRSPRHRMLFDTADRSGAFMLGDMPRSNLGDADFRSVSVAFLVAESKVHRFVHLPYAHPVPWDAPY